MIINCELKSPPPLKPLKRNLKYLSLNYNNLSRFPWDYFYGFLALGHFSAKKNLLTLVPSMNEVAPHLRILELDFNIITEATGKWRENGTLYESLIKLTLRGNNIVSVDAGLMKALPGITMLDLRENSITHFEDPTQYLVGRSWEYTVDLGENPLDCESHLAWVVSAWHVLGDATCSTPVCVNGSAIHTMSKYRVRSWDNGVYCMSCYRQISNISRTHTQNSNISRLLKPGVKSKMGCNWSSADIWVINNFIVYYGAFYIRGFTVYPHTRSPTCFTHSWTLLCVHHIASHRIPTTRFPYLSRLCQWHKNYGTGDIIWGIYHLLHRNCWDRKNDTPLNDTCSYRSQLFHLGDWNVHLLWIFSVFSVLMPKMQLIYL